MKQIVYLLVSRVGVHKLVKARPYVDRGYRALRLSITIPDAAFTEPADFDIDLQVPETALLYPAVDCAADVAVVSGDDGLL